MDSFTATPPLRFFFDYSTPYAYLAWKLLLPLAERQGRSVEPVPVHYPAILKAHQMREAHEIHSWRRYLFKDVIRIAKVHGFVIIPPIRDPVPSLLALRVSSLPMDPEARIRLVDGLFSATWAGARDITELEEIAAVAQAAGLDGRAVADAAQTTEPKERLKAQTDAALALGLWSLPMVAADGELFWRHDSFPYLERFLRGEDPINPERVAHWERVRGFDKQGSPRGE